MTEWVSLIEKSEQVARAGPGYAQRALRRRPTLALCMPWLGNLKELVIYGINGPNQQTQQIAEPTDMPWLGNR